MRVVSPNLPLRLRWREHRKHASVVASGRLHERSPQRRPLPGVLALFPFAAGIVAKLECHEETAHAPDRNGQIL